MDDRVMELLAARVPVTLLMDLYWGDGIDFAEVCAVEGQPEDWLPQQRGAELSRPASARRDLAVPLR